MLKAFLQGKPFGHPLHPALVHFPIGLFVLGLILDLASYFVGEASNSMVRASYYALTLGVGEPCSRPYPILRLVQYRLDHPQRKRPYSYDPHLNATRCLG